VERAGDAAVSRDVLARNLNAIGGWTSPVELYGPVVFAFCFGPVVLGTATGMGTRNRWVVRGQRLGGVSVRAKVVAKALAGLRILEQDVDPGRETKGARRRGSKVLRGRSGGSLEE